MSSVTASRAVRGQTSFGLSDEHAARSGQRVRSLASVDELHQLVEALATLVTGVLAPLVVEQELLLLPVSDVGSAVVTDVGGDGLDHGYSLKSSAHAEHTP